MGLTVWHFVTGAPLTYGWLFVLMITTIIQNELPGRQLRWVLLHRSTNIHQLGTDPLGVLFSSLLWIDGKSLEPYLLLFTLFLAPAEHWLGQLRWLTVGLTAHLLGTYASEGILYYAIEGHYAPERMVNARDIGVSYFLVAILGVLTYRIARPWCWAYLAVLFVIFGIPLLSLGSHGGHGGHGLNFTAIGHFASLVIGLCFYPMARGRNRPPLRPADVKTAVRRFVSGAA